MSLDQPSARAVMARLCEFCFPGGAEAARGIIAVRLTERGAMRSAANARWTEFTSEMEIEATRSRFRWEARLRGAMGWFGVTDAYQDGRGSLAIRVAGVAVRKMCGPAFDRGELQRYLASLAACPTILLNHASMEWSAAGENLLRLQDRLDPTGSAVTLVIGLDGSPAAGCALRPRALGKQTVDTPWRVSAADFREIDGLRIPMRLEAWWEPETGPFRYYWSDMTSFAAVR